MMIDTNEIHLLTTAFLFVFMRYFQVLRCLIAEFIVIRNESEDISFERHPLNFRSLLSLGCENMEISFGVTLTESKSAINLPRIGCCMHLD